MFNSQGGYVLKTTGISYINATLPIVINKFLFPWGSDIGPGSYPIAATADKYKIVLYADTDKTVGIRWAILAI